MSVELQSELLDILRKNEAISARFRDFNIENSHVLSDDDLDSDSAPILEFLNRREQYIEALMQLTEQSKALEAQLQEPPPAVSDEIAMLHVAIDANLRAILSLDKNSITVVQEHMQRYRAITGQTRGRKKQITSYLRSEVVGIDVHEYDKIR